MMVKTPQFHLLEGYGLAVVAKVVHTHKEMTPLILNKKTMTRL